MSDITYLSDKKHTLIFINLREESCRPVGMVF